MSAETGDHSKPRAGPTLNSMNERGDQLLEAHIRSLDPGEATARERLAAAIGEPLARRLVCALRSHY
jgi:hypothetical protein